MSALPDFLSSPCEAPVPLPLIIISPPDLKTQRLCVQKDRLVIKTNGSNLELAVALSARIQLFSTSQSVICKRLRDFYQNIPSGASAVKVSKIKTNVKISAS